MHVQAVEHFRANVVTAMKSRGWTQETLAEASELTRPFINRVLRGKQEPSLEVCDRIADALSLELSELLTSPKKFRQNVPSALAG